MMHSPEKGKLQKENQYLKNELNLAKETIQKMKSEILSLKRQIKYLEEQLNQKPITSELSHHTKSKKAKSNKSLQYEHEHQGEFEQVLEQFSNSESGSETEDYFNGGSNSVLHSLGNKHGREKLAEFKTFSSMIQTPEKTHSPRTFKLKPILGSQIKLQGKSTSTTKSLKKIPSLPQSNITRMKSVEAYHLPKEKSSPQIPIENQDSSSHELSIAENYLAFESSHRQKGSAIKQEGSIFKPPIQQRIFKKVNIANPIYSCFFITGVDSNNKPTINYFYPKKSEHFDAILALCYTDDFLKPKEQLFINGSQSQKNLSISSVHHNNSSHLKVKEFYILPLRKDTQSNKQNLREYLIVYESQETFFTEKEKQPCIFNRLYCFISDFKLFNSFRNLTTQFLDKLTEKRSDNQSLSENSLRKLHQSELEQALFLLSQKSTEQNQTLNYRLDSNISLVVDIPSEENSFKLVSEFRPWGVLNIKLQIKNDESHIANLETKLFGILLAYVLSEKKVILFSTYKSRISQAVLHVLEIIKPLEYVSPVLMAALKEDHFEYFSAPMSLILGLWTEQKKMQRQKIEIFMNKKENLAGMIQKGKIQTTDGIVVNLDTGLVYGNGLSSQITGLGLKLNEYYQNYCHRPKEIFKLFEKLLDSTRKKQRELSELSQKILAIIQQSQLYEFYLSKNRKELSLY